MMPPRARNPQTCWSSRSAPRRSACCGWWRLVDVNPEIARELVVSVNTIKTQVQSIYRKLNVNTRDEAREAARELDLNDWGADR